MKFIKGYNQFVIEGAHLVPPTYDQVELSWKDDKTLPLEVLKTNVVHDVSGFVKVGRTKGGSFELYYGLTVDPNRNKKLGSEDPLFKITLDKLKNANIVNSTKSLYKFTAMTAREILSKKGKIDYVVSLGSTAGLSTDLGKIFNSQFKDSKFIPLSKYEFDNFQQALNWEYIRDYDTKVEVEGKTPIIDKVQQDVIDAIDLEKTNPAIIAAIRRTENADDLRGILLKADPKNRYHEYDPTGRTTIFWKKDPYIIRSSGLSYRGSRQWFKTKYDTPKPTGEIGSLEFMEAVKECILYGKTMIFVDDNARTKEDISKIFDVISSFAENLIQTIGRPELVSNRRFADSVLSYHKRFLAYVLIYLPVPSSNADSRDITVQKLASDEDVQKFSMGGLTNIQKWIKQNRK